MAAPSNGANVKTFEGDVADEGLLQRTRQVQHVLILDVTSADLSRLGTQEKVNADRPFVQEFVGLISAEGWLPMVLDPTSTKMLEYIAFSHNICNGTTDKNFRDWASGDHDKACDAMTSGQTLPEP
eukprot:1765925-Amphidinium_carterae.1